MTQLAVTIVMPAYNAASHLPRVIPAAIAALKGGRLIVVDPGSSDGTAALARDLGAEVLELGHRAGPALARNRGVELVKTPICLFIDADCVAHANVVEMVQALFDSNPDLVSVTGSYDDSPPEQNFFSQYMNLRHHYTHHQANPDGSSFWAGCGAVRTEVFRRIGGFDAEQFPMPMIEDIELAFRLRPQGKMRLDSALQVTHLKRWSLRGVVTTDIFSRAVPWSKLILATGELPNDLNLAWTQRLAAAAAPFSLISPVAIPAALLLGLPGVAAAFGASAAFSGWVHRGMFAFFWRRRGPAFAVGAVLFHQVHLIYSAATLAVLTLQRIARGRESVARKSA
jgi:cellulose synthase/poly-beta-1,6-N-acetylglucosamine synthase-like glycosyltransferase